MILKKRNIFFLLLTTIAMVSNKSFSASSFFAKDSLRSLFDIKMAKEEIIQKEAPISKKNIPLKVLVWNIYKGDLFKKSPLPINFKDYSLILLQEYSSDIAQKYLPQSHLYFLPTFKWEGALTGVAIYSNILLTNTKALHTKYREPFILTPKSSIIAKYQDITIINTHALNFVSDKEWIFELQQISKNIISSKKIIWAGDFNSWDSQRTVYIRNFMASHHLKEVKFQQDNRTTHLGFPIDYIFIKGLSVKSSTSLQTPNHSDHNPVSVEFN